MFINKHSTAFIGFQYRDLKVHPIFQNGYQSRYWPLGGL